MNSKPFFSLLFSFFLLFALTGCGKERVEPLPPVDTVTEEPYQEHLDDLNGSTEEVEVPAEEDVILTSFQANDVISAPMTLEGMAKGRWYFEASFPVRILNEKGDELLVTHAEAQEDWMQPGYVPFKVEIKTFSPGASTSGKLVLEKDNPSGLPENDKKIEIPVRFIPGETSKVKVFFHNSKEDPEMLDCGKVSSVERVIPKTSTVARAAVEELLKGPSVSEKNAGFTTSINPGVKIQRLVIEHGVAKVDFDQQLQSEVGGSCRVQAIRSQIEQTLRQFPTVSDVVISIDGESEDILQP